MTTGLERQARTEFAQAGVGRTGAALAFTAAALFSGSGTAAEATPTGAGVTPSAAATLPSPVESAPAPEMPPPGLGIGAPPGIGIVAPPGIGIGAPTGTVAIPPPAADVPFVIAFDAGVYKCELGRSVHVREITTDRRTITLHWSRKDYTLAAVEARTGALRFEDAASGFVWIVIPAKAMLLDTRSGRQLANECRL